MPVLDIENGQTLEYCQLLRHPNFQYTRNQYYCNELGLLCQCFGTSHSGTCPRVKGIDTFLIIKYEDIPPDRRKEFTYTEVV